MTTIEKNVMTSVAVIYAVRRLMGATALKVYALLLSAAGIVFFVSLSNVLENFAVVASGGIASIGVFAVSAVLGTTLLVQLALFLGTLSLLSLCADALRTITGVRSAAA